MLKKILNYFGFALIDSEFIDIYKNLNYKYGWGKSVEIQRPVNSDDIEIPWFTFPAIEYLSQIDMSTFDVFEWGSGNSSKYFARKCRSITSIESNSDWFKAGVENLEENQKLFLFSVDEYASSINRDPRKYDMIIIDGIVRYDCGCAALSKIKDDGVIVVDNSDWHPNTCKLLRSSLRFIQVDFHGFGPINSYSWTTSLFISRGAEIKYLGDRQPQYSTAGIIQVSDFDKARQ